MKKRKRLSVTARHNLSGIYFLIPFYLGMIFFYLNPILNSILFSFSEVKVGLSGYEMDFCGFDNFKYVLRSDDAFTTKLAGDLLNLLWKTPVIVILSLCLALILNSKYKGRLLVRAIFFLPVIVSTGYVLDIIQGDSIVKGALSTAASMGSSATSQSAGISDLLIQAGISQKIVDFISMVTDNFFSLVWNTGIQMLIFLAGLQGISGTLYEAASVEGASAWESFCKITIPMLSPIIILNIIYTVVDSYSSTKNGAFTLITNNISLNRFGTASAMAWIYFIFIGIILAIVLLCARKKD